MSLTTMAILPPRRASRPLTSNMASSRRAELAEQAASDAANSLSHAHRELAADRARLVDMEAKLAKLKEQGYKVVHVVPATELKPPPSPDTPVASASPDGTGLPAAATNPAAARHAASAAVAAASVGAGADSETEAAAPKAAQLMRVALLKDPEVRARIIAPPPDSARQAGARGIYPVANCLCGCGPHQKA